MFLCAMLLFFGAVGFANAIQIGSFSAPYAITFGDSIITSVDVEATNIGSTVFDTLLTSSSDVGTEFFISSATDSGFNGFTSVITNGSDDVISMWMRHPDFGGGLGAGPFESQAFGTAPDFAGYTVDMLGLDVIALNFDYERSPGDTFVSGTLNFNVYGTPVPVPAAIYLLGAGFVGLAGLRRKLKK
jgi:hypothetical protein